MDRSLLDTDIFSEVLKGMNHKVVDSATEYHREFGYYSLSTITVMEIVKGFHRLGREERIRQFLNGLSSIELLTLDRRSSELAGRIYADLEKFGLPIGRADPMIASIAISNGFTLITGNTSHYKHIQSVGYNLKLDNWR